MINKNTQNLLIAVGLISSKWVLALILIAMLTGGFNQPPTKQSPKGYMIGVGVIR